MTSAAPPLVSVVVPTRDRRALLRDALASVRAIEGPDLRIEIIVADNGSTDGSEAVVEEFGARMVTASTPGASAARNVGFRVAAGDYILFLDDDDVMLPGHLRPHLRLLAERPDLDAVIGQVQVTDNALRPINGPYPDEMPDDGDFFRPFLNRTPQVGATLARMSVRETVGSFDEGLPSSEDWDWHLRLALRHRIGFVRVPCVLFRQRGLATHDDLEWMRMRYSRAVLVRNLRRAGRRGPGPVSSVRTFLRSRGGFYWYFANSALTHARAGDRAALHRCIGRALVASPLHAARDLTRRSDLRSAIAALLGQDVGEAGAAPISDG